MTNQEEEKLKKNIEYGRRWIKPIEKSKNFKSTLCPPFNSLKDYKQDNTSFLLIKINKEKKEIVVGICSYNHELLEEFRGTIAQQIYNYILNNTSYISRLDHAAYLGKELKKAEIALKENKEYLQE